MRAFRFNGVRLLAASCLLVWAALVGGCGGEPSRDLPARTIYFSVPLSGPLAQRGRDLADGAVLALDQTNYDTPDVRIKLRVLDSKNEALNLRVARADRNALAYVTNREPAAQAATASVRDPLLRITLAPDTAPPNPASSEVIHLLPSAAYAGMALAQAVTDGNPRAVILRGGGAAFGRAALAAFRQAMGAAPAPVADIWFEHENTAAPLTAHANAGEGPGETFQLDHVNQPDPSTAVNLVTPAMASRDYPHSGKRFAKAFSDFHGREPDRFAIYGYEATGLALNAATDAGESDGTVTRAATLKAALALRNRFGPVGHYDVLPGGQTTLYMFGIRPWPLDLKVEEEESRTIEVARG
ncbi:MAG: hypothetical protein HY827_02535 [Actinobacteria bacterium]|nr:hypothetical protein [Actinomycetota bacterium]